MAETGLTGSTGLMKHPPDVVAVRGIAEVKATATAFMGLQCTVSEGGVPSQQIGSVLTGVGGHGKRYDLLYRRY